MQLYFDMALSYPRKCSILWYDVWYRLIDLERDYADFYREKSEDAIRLSIVQTKTWLTIILYICKYDWNWCLRIYRAKLSRNSVYKDRWYNWMAIYLWSSRLKNHRKEKKYLKPISKAYMIYSAWMSVLYLYMHTHKEQVDLLNKVVFRSGTSFLFTGGPKDVKCPPVIS